MHICCSRLLISALTLVGFIGGTNLAQASGPHWVAGVNYFNPAAKGSPVVWTNGQVSYFVDQGDLSSAVSNSQAASMVASAAAVWSSVPTAGVSITQGGSLSEDVSGGNVAANTPAGTGATLPADAQPSSANANQVAIVFDADGSVIDDIYGPTASDPNACTQTGVYSTVDSFATSGSIAHALILINGRCATSSDLNALLQYELVRAFGRVLGLDWSQVNETMWPNPTSDGLAGWPLMHPAERQCAGSMTVCMPNQTTLRADDIAGLNQLYPVTNANAGSWNGKTITAPATITVQGTITFRNGQGMQGVNVVLTPLNGNEPDLRYTVSAVSGAFYRTSSANAITGLTDAQRNVYGRFGTDDATKEGYFMLSGVPLPQGATAATYQLSIEPVNALYTGKASVGPYAANQVAPSGAMQTVLLGSLSAGESIVTQNFVMADSADGSQTDDGVEAQPNSVGSNGEWMAKLTGYGHAGWFQFHTRANRSFTVEAASLDESGRGTETKAAVLIGMWNGSDPLGTLPDVASTTPFNGSTVTNVGLSSLTAKTISDGEVRIAFADSRGDGRPDFTYRARVLYADSVFPARLILAGGTISIQGQGFRPGITVLVNGATAQVTSLNPTEITAVAPAVNAATGVVAVTVFDPQTLGTAAILDGLSYDAQGTDDLRSVSGPSGTLSQGVPVAMTVQVVAGDGKTPAANVTVTYAVQSGSASLNCTSSPCTVLTNASGMATMMVTPTGTQATEVSAAIANGAAPLIADFNGATQSQIAATNTLYVAIGAQVSWSPVAIVLNGGNAVQGTGVQWRDGGTGSGAQVTAATASTMSDASGLATTTVNVGPLAADAIANVYACETAGGPCATFTITAVHTELASLLPVSGAGQSLAAAGTVAPVTLEVVDAAGHPIAGATVNFYQQMNAWQPPCPAMGRCPAAQKLGSLTTPVISDANGLVTLIPMSADGQAVTLHVLATTGQQGTLNFTITQHP